MDIVNYAKESVKLYFEPSKGFKYFKKNVDWKVAFLIVYVLSTLGSLISELLYPTEDGIGLIFVILAIIIAGFIGLAIIALVGYGLLHLFLKWFGGKASFKDTFGFALTVGIFPSLFGLIFAFLPVPEGATAAITVGVISALLGLIITVWSITIGALIYSKLHKVSVLRAIGAMLLPAIIFIVIVLIVVGVVLALVL